MITYFDHPHTGSLAEIAAHVGGKGASLWTMTRQLGLPVPPGFTIGTEHCQTGLTDRLFDAVMMGLDRIGDHVGRHYGDHANPLLLSVRSGAAVSMPGMMDTILNVGLTPDRIASFDDGDFARSSYAAFAAQFAKSVANASGVDMGDPVAILRAAINAVFASWDSPRARHYRERAGIAEGTGTAVTIQAMVFGNRCARSGTGVAFSRNPSTGAPGAVGDWLAQAQGEAVVAGTHATSDLMALARQDSASHKQLIAALDTLEMHYRDMVDVEFTIESGTLWILQARAGKRTPAAAARIAHDLVAEARTGMDKSEAIERVPQAVLDGTMVVSRRAEGATAIAHGVGVSPGLASGRIAFDCDNAIDMADAGHAVILVRNETSPEDVHGMGVSAGILTTTGGAMSHAALVAREWGIAAVCGADITIGADHMTAGRTHLRAGDVISIDGSTGEVFAGTVSGSPMPDTYADVIRRWAADHHEKECVYGQT